MKKLNVMIYTETLEALCELPNEDIGVMIRYINDWNNGKEVIVENPYLKSMWKMILPDLERNKETFLHKCEINSLNGKKGGAPLGNQNAKKTKTTEGLIETTENKPKQHNYNSNYNYNSNDNSSKDELSNIGQPSSPEGDEVVSKGLEKIESIFPNKKNYVGIDTVNLWNSFTQEEKQVLIRRATLYVREELKKNDGMYLKQLTKWLQEQKEKGIEIKPKDFKNKTSNDDHRLLKYTDGSIYTFILEKVGNSTQKADKVYSQFNRKDLYSNKDQMIEGLFDYFKM
jgi:hypothetical protein